MTNSVNIRTHLSAIEFIPLEIIKHTKKCKKEKHEYETGNGNKKYHIFQLISPCRLSDVIREKKVSSFEGRR